MTQTRAPNLRNRILASLGFLLLVSGIAASVSGDSWPTGGDSEKRGASSAEAAPGNSPAYSWVFARTFSDAVSVDGRVYVAGADRVPQSSFDSNVGMSLYALDENTGAIVWERLLYAAGQIPVYRNIHIGTPTYSNGRVYFLDDSATVWALSASDGSLVWKARVAKDAWAGRTAPLVVSNKVIVAVDNEADPNGIGASQIVGLDAATGGQVWRVDQIWNGGAELSSDGTRFFVTNGAFLTARQVSDGAPLWVAQPSARHGGGLSNPVVGNGVVYVTSQNNAYGDYMTLVYALHPGTGQTVWENSFSGGEPNCCGGQYENIYPPAVDDDLLVVIGRGQVRAVSTQTQEILWQRSIDGPIAGAPILTADSILLARAKQYVPIPGVKLEGGNLFALDRANGNTRWSFQAEDPVTADHSQTRFGFANQRILGGFRHIPNYQIPHANALFALGGDSIAPVWPADAAIQGSQANGIVKLRWGPAKDLNMQGFVIERSGSPSGPWTRVGETAWSGKINTEWSPVDAGFNFETSQNPGTQHYRILAKDSAGHLSIPLQTSVTVLSPGPTYHTDPVPPTTTTAPPPTTSAAPVPPRPSPGPAPAQAGGSPTLPPCGASPATASNTWYPQITRPASGDYLNGIVDVTGHVAHSGASGGPTMTAPPMETFVHARIGNNRVLTALFPGSQFSVPFNTDNVQDGEYKIWAETRTGSQGPQLSNTVCVTVNNGKPIFFTELANWVDPNPAAPDSRVGLVYYSAGESVFQYNEALVTHYIDGIQVGQVRVAVENFGDLQGNGLYDFRLADHFDYPLVQRQGDHEHWVEVRYGVDSNQQHAFTTSPFPFAIGPVVATQGATPTARPATPTAEPVTPPGPGFQIEPFAIALDASLPKKGDSVAVYARAVNRAHGPAHGTAALAIVSPAGAIEYSARFPLSIVGDDEELITAKWVPALEGRYEIWAAIEDATNTLSPADSARSGAYATHRVFHVGPQPDDRPTLLLTSGLLNIGTIDEGSSRTISVDVTAYGHEARDVRLDVFEDAGLVVIPLTPPTTVPAGQTVKFYLRISVPDLPNNATVQDHRLLIRAANDASSSNVEAMDVIAHPVEFRGLPFFGPAATIAAVAAAGGAAAYFRRRD